MRRHGINTATRRRGVRVGAGVLTAAAALTGLSRPASADVFNGRIAFTSLRDGDREIYTVTARGGDLRQLTVNAANDAQPDWAPDGRALASGCRSRALGPCFRWRACRPTACRPTASSRRS